MILLSIFMEALLQSVSPPMWRSSVGGGLHDSPWDGDPDELHLAGGFASKVYNTVAGRPNFESVKDAQEKIKRWMESLSQIMPKSNQPSDIIKNQKYIYESTVDKIKYAQKYIADHNATLFKQNPDGMINGGHNSDVNHPNWVDSHHNNMGQGPYNMGNHGPNPGDPQMGNYGQHYGQQQMGNYGQRYGQQQMGNHGHQNMGSHSWPNHSHPNNSGSHSSQVSTPPTVRAGEKNNSSLWGLIWGSKTSNNHQSHGRVQEGVGKAPSNPPSKAQHGPSVIPTRPVSAGNQRDNGKHDDDESYDPQATWKYDTDHVENRDDSAMEDYKHVPHNQPPIAPSKYDLGPMEEIRKHNTPPQQAHGSYNQNSPQQQHIIGPPAHAHPFPPQQHPILGPHLIVQHNGHPPQPYGYHAPVRLVSAPHTPQPVFLVPGPPPHH